MLPLFRNHRRSRVGPPGRKRGEGTDFHVCVRRQLRRLRRCEKAGILSARATVTRSTAVRQATRFADKNRYDARADM